MCIRIWRLLSETPPHARGRRARQAPQPETVGNTPACAGKTAPWPCSAAVRKETPPHARGRLLRLPFSFCRFGNTPACAGKTQDGRMHVDKSKKHPRMRGEDRQRHTLHNAEKETPPHARGRPEVKCWKNPKTRNTPACAGKTRLEGSSRFPGGKHPRMRGEDRKSPREAGLWLETPPHARGRRVHRGRRSIRDRNTPACAGKTGGVTDKRPRPWKHPRMRGEDPCPISAGHDRMETPPHARGRHQSAAAACARFGNTPACAGKTS